MVCNRAQPAADGESARGAGGTGLGEGRERAGRPCGATCIGVLPMMSVKRVRERGRGECGLTFSPARGVVCSKRGGIREVSAEDKKTNFFTGSEGNGTS